MTGVLIMAAHSIGTLYLLIQYARHFKYNPALPVVSDEDLPYVTIQIPLYNERFVAHRIIETVSQLDYPHDRLHIQVLDDSTDETTALIRQQIEALQAMGLRIDLIRRVNRVGFKAGALEHGMHHTDGEFIAIFDADFVPPQDFLRRTIPYFLTDPGLGVVQTRWAHLNDRNNLLTRAQGLAIDGHFAVEQFTRSAANIPFSFNGTCGLWRKTCIEDAGGWQHDTLTEDFDLSYRAQIRGWHFMFVRDVSVPGEVPAQVSPYKHQQARWAKGSTQVMRKMIVPLWKSNMNLRNKLMGSLQLAQYAIQPIIFFMMVFTPMMMVTGALRDLPLWQLGLLAIMPPILYSLGQMAIHKDWVERMLFFPVLMVVSSGMSFNNARAAIDAFSRRPSEFKRTPKFNLSNKGKRVRGNQYLNLADKDAIVEAMCGFYMWISAALATRLAPTLVPYFVISAIGFFCIPGWNLADRIMILLASREAVSAPEPEKMPVPQSAPMHLSSEVEVMAEPVGQPGR